MFRTLKQIEWDDIDVGEVFCSNTGFGDCDYISVKITKGMEFILADGETEYDDITGKKCFGSSHFYYYRLPKAVQRLYFTEESE